MLKKWGSWLVLIFAAMEVVGMVLSYISSYANNLFLHSFANLLLIASTYGALLAVLILVYFIFQRFWGGVIATIIFLISKFLVLAFLFLNISPSGHRDNALAFILSLGVLIYFFTVVKKDRQNV